MAEMSKGTEISAGDTAAAIEFPISNSSDDTAAAFEFTIDSVDNAAVFEFPINSIDNAAAFEFQISSSSAVKGGVPIAHLTLFRGYCSGNRISDLKLFQKCILEAFLRKFGGSRGRLPSFVA